VRLGLADFVAEPLGPMLQENRWKWMELSVLFPPGIPWGLTKGHHLPVPPIPVGCGRMPQSGYKLEFRELCVAAGWGQGVGDFLMTWTNVVILNSYHLRSILNDVCIFYI
jgi:hypothetical protein